MDILRAEGLGYFEQQLNEINGFESDIHYNLYAIHSNETWEIVEEEIKALSMFWFLFEDVKLIKETKIKNGMTNYIFKTI